MSHPIVHVELASESPGELAQFYGQIFNWQLQEYPEMNYTTFSPGDGSLGGGINEVRDEIPKGTVVFYIQTDDIGASLEQIQQSGGEVIWEPMEVPGVGKIAQFRDPSGNRVGLLQPAEGTM
ncbi:MAG TPA: VOC family protein [Candidatus Sulfomarinibacteraceae bacterium]|nr:VOC family protein [Candidatus Sulfomarinibacteraceae bacterium]